MIINNIIAHDPGRGLAPGNNALLAWCCVGSIAAHLLLLQVLPGWRQAKETPPQPLTVELRQPPPPQIVPPKPLPVEVRPQPRERPKPVPLKPEPPVLPPREERPPETPRAPVLTAPPEAPPAAATFAVPAPEPKPAPPPEPPPRPQPPPAPVTVTAPRSDAAYLNNPKPVYPLAARRRGDQGTVLVRVLVTAEGTAASVSLEKSSGVPALDESALSAVKSWRFVPARQGTQAIEAPYVVPVVFKLD